MDPKPPSLDALRIDRSKIPQDSGNGRLWWILLLLLVLAGAGCWWFTRTKAIPVKTAIVTAQSSSSSGGRTLLNASGYVTTRLDATVSSKITGKVAEILVEEGMKVEKDQVLARLDASNVESSLRLAQAQLASAKMNLAETEPMVKYTEAELARLSSVGSDRAVSRSDLGKAEAEARCPARQTRTPARRHHRRRAPGGRVETTARRHHHPRALRRSGHHQGLAARRNDFPDVRGGGFTRTGICTLVDMASLEIEVDVGESFINRVKAGQPVEATLDAYPDWKIPGKVIAIIPTADRQKATVKVRVGFEKLDPRILPQMGVKVAFKATNPPNPPRPPARSAFPRIRRVKIDNRDIAWVVKDGKVERRAVTVANSNSSEATVSAGLSAGETVVLDPPATLTDGAAVTVETSR